MPYPIRCLSCGDVPLDCAGLKFLEQAQNTNPPMDMGTILDKLGLVGHEYSCCRVMIMSTVQTDEHTMRLIRAKAKTVQRQLSESTTPLPDALAMQPHRRAPMSK